MKIYTKHGDQGETSLLGGQRVPKNHIRIQAYGTIDELNAYLGLVRSKLFDEQIKDFLLKCQKDLFVIGSQLAAPEGRIAEHIDCIAADDVVMLEQAIDGMDKELPPLNNFIVPGGDTVAAEVHVARSICRRAERLIVELSLAEDVHVNIIKYINRFSDYLFTLARMLNKQKGISEVKWE